MPDKEFNDGIYFKTKVFNVETRFLIDTGAATSLLSYKIYNKIPKEVHPDLHKYHRKLVGSNGTEIINFGWIISTEYW